MIRTLFWLVLLFALATALALLGQHGSVGKVIVLSGAKRFDVSLNFAIIAIVVVFIAVYALLRVLHHLIKTPQRIQGLRARSRVNKAQQALGETIGALFSGRFSQAEKMAGAAQQLPQTQDAASLLGACAAQRMQDYTGRDEWLSAMNTPRWQETRCIAQAKMRVDSGDAAGALAALSGMREKSLRQIYVQRIALRANQQLQKWPDVLKGVKSLKKRDVLPEAEAAQLYQLAGENLLRACQNNSDALLECWRGLPSEARALPGLAKVAAELLLTAGAIKPARQIVEETLARQWDACLLQHYADCAGDDPVPLLQRAETWQTQHGNDPDLLYTLGALCMQQKLWGKAQSYFEQALSLTSDQILIARLHRALAQLHETLGNAQQANRHWRSCADLATI